MLTAKQNMDEVIQGGKPERYCNNYEAIQLTFHPFMMHSPTPQKGQLEVVDAWGVTNSWPENVPGAFPVHTPEKVVIKDFEHWKDYLHAPNLDFPDAEWDQFKAQMDAFDQTQTYVSPFVAPGIFERMHHCGEITNTLCAFYDYEDEVHDLVKYITDWEMKLADQICTHLQPDVIFHHDDWGGMDSTFMSATMFEEFFVDAYKELYGYYHERGCKYVFHHSDSYAATLVPDMIEMGINVWQGCMSSNNLPELVKKYGDKITFMGGFDGAMVDTPDWTEEGIRKHVFDYIDSVGSMTGFIPCIAQGGPGSVYPGVYDALVKAIDEYSIEKCGVKKEDIKRLPLQVLF